MTTWTGKPRWNGNARNVKITECLLPYMPLQGPLTLQLENCDDYFLPIFSDSDKLHEVMAKLGFVGYNIKQITDAEDFLDSVKEGGIRVMLDPQIINKHHTKWLEVVKQGEEYLFVDQESN
jgi:hypothetical protein